MKQLKSMQKKGKALLNKAAKASKGVTAVIPTAVVAGIALALDPVTTLVVAGGLAVGVVATSTFKK